VSSIDLEGGHQLISLYSSHRLRHPQSQDAWRCDSRCAPFLILFSFRTAKPGVFLGFSKLSSGLSSLLSSPLLLAHRDIILAWQASGADQCSLVWQGWRT